MSPLTGVHPLTPIWEEDPKQMDSGIGWHDANRLQSSRLLPLGSDLRFCPEELDVCETNRMKSAPARRIAVRLGEGVHHPVQEAI